MIEQGERVGLVGVNGCGKSTLMKVLTGEVKADTSTIQMQRGMRSSHLAQEPYFPPGATPSSELTVAQQPLRDALDGWDRAFESRKLLDRLGVDPASWDQPIDQLSGGQKKRVAIARALLTHADLLMFDEPTNHLDAETVEWLEEEIDSRDSALLLVTHDRYFLDGLVDRIIEVEPHVSEQQPGGLVSYAGNYEAYLEQKFVKLEEQKVGEHKRQMWIAQEVAWLRKGPKARATKSKARIERARIAAAMEDLYRVGGDAHGFISVTIEQQLAGERCVSISARPITYGCAPSEPKKLDQYPMHVVPGPAECASTSDACVPECARYGQVLGGTELETLAFRERCVSRCRASDAAFLTCARAVAAPADVRRCDSLR